MPYSKSVLYNMYRRQGYSPSDAATLSKYPQHAAMLAEGADYKQEQATAATPFGSKGIRAQQGLSAAGLNAEALYNSTTPNLYGIEQEKQQTWWQSALDGVMEGVSYIAAPQQAIWQWASGGDMRRAVPDSLQKAIGVADRWAEEGAAHEFIDFGDVVDHHTNGGYEEMLQELEDGGWASKWLLGGGLKVGEFAVDAVADPMNLVIGAGLGSKIVSGIRRTLPKAVQMEVTTKIARRMRTVDAYNDAIKAQLAVMDDVRKGLKAAPDDAVLQGKMQLLRAQLRDTTDAARKIQSDDPLRGVSIRRASDLKDPGPNASPLERRIYETRKQALLGRGKNPKRAPVPGMFTTLPDKFVDEGVETLVDVAKLDNEAAALRAGLGPDSAEEAAEALGHVARGVDPHDTGVTRILGDVEPTRTSLETTIPGIGRDGMITDKVLGSHEIFDEVTEFHAKTAQSYVDAKELVETAKKDVTKARNRVKEAEKLNKKAGDYTKQRALKVRSQDTLRRQIGQQEAKLEQAIRSKKATKEIRERIAKLSEEANKVDEQITKLDDLLRRADVEDARGILDEAEAVQKSWEVRRDELKARTKASQKNIDHFNKTGRFPDELGGNPDIKLPWGPRRDVLRSTQFMDERWGNDFLRYMGHGLSPHSMWENSKSMAFSYFFREPMRMLETHVPGAWDLMRGHMKTRDYHMNHYMGYLNDVFEKYGILNRNQAAAKGAKAFGIRNAGLTVDQHKNRALWDLLDAKRGSAEWDDALRHYGLKEGDDLVKAHDEVRAMLDYIGKTQLGLSGDEFIEGYITHVAKAEGWFEKGLPWEYRGSARSGSTPGFLQERTGVLGDNVGAVDALDGYIRGVTKHLYTDPMLAELDNLVEDMARKFPQKAEYLRKASTMLRATVKGETSTVGQFIDFLPGGLGEASRRVASTIGALTYSAALTGNPRYVIMSLAQNINSTAAEFGALRTLKGLARQFTTEGKVAARAVGLADEHAKIMDHMTNKVGEWAADLRPLMLPTSITDTEFMIRGVTFHASVDDQLMRLGFKSFKEAPVGVQREILAKAVKDTESINHVFGVVGRPVWMSRFSKTGTAVGTQFMSFPFKQTETLWQHSKNNPGFMWDYLVMAGQLVHIGHKANVELQDYVGVGYAKDFTGSRDLTSMPVDTMSSMLNFVTTAFDPEALSTEKWDAVDDLSKGLTNLIPMKTAFGAAKKAKQKFGGTMYDNNDIPKRHTNMRLTGTDAQIPGGNEFWSAISGLKSEQDKTYEEIRKGERVRRDKIRRAEDIMMARIKDHVRAGEPISQADVAAYHKALLQAGKKVDMATLQKKILDSKWLYNSTLYIQNSRAGGAQSVQQQLILKEKR